MVLVAPGLYYRHLTVREVLRRQRERNEQQVAEYNTHFVEQLDVGPTPSLHDQALEQFPAGARRLARR